MVVRAAAGSHCGKGSNRTGGGCSGSAGTSNVFESTMSFGSGFSRFQSPAPGRTQRRARNLRHLRLRKRSSRLPPALSRSSARPGRLSARASSAPPKFASANFGSTLGRPPLAPRGAGGGGGSSGFFNLGALGRKTTTAPRGGPPDDDAGATADAPPSVTQPSDDGSGFASSGFDSARRTRPPRSRARRLAPRQRRPRSRASSR